MSGRLKLYDRLARDGRRYGLFQAIRLLECARRDLPRAGCAMRALDEPVRFGQEPELRFLGSEIAGFLQPTTDRHARLAVNVQGLLGTNGPMPLWLTEYVRERVRTHSDTTLRAFLDIFHHRLVNLLYRAWAAGQPVVSHDRPDGNDYAWYAASLCGLAARQQPDGASRLIGRGAKLQFTGLLASRVRHAAGLRAVLMQDLCVPVAIEESVGQWLEVAEDEATRFVRKGVRPGHRAARQGTTEAAGVLGHGCALGRRVFDRQHRFRVVLGPLGPGDYARFEPEAPSLARLLEWVTLYAGPVLDWDVELLLAPGAAAPMRLDRRARLARSAWIGRPEAGRTRPALRFDARMRAGRRVPPHVVPSAGG